MSLSACLIREGIEEEAWEEAKYYVKVVSDVVDSLVKQVGEARTLVDALGRR